jgi:hypothetical protein
MVAYLMTSPRRTSCRIFAVPGPVKRLNRSLPREASGDDPRGAAPKRPAGSQSTRS